MAEYLGELNIIEGFFLGYFILIYGSYFIQAIGSAIIVRNYVKRTKLFDPYDMLEGDYLPKVALIAPAYNESAVVIESVTSLLGIQYFNYDLVVVNDGSKDDTLQKLIDHFELEISVAECYGDIETKPLKNLYRSTNEAYSNLIVLDKVNGRKADAINVGINHTLADYYAVIDLDCILEQDVLLKLVEPILHQKEKKVVAIGGVIGSTNGSDISYGTLTNLVIPKSFLPKIQVIEYVRSFISARPFWAKFNGLLLISGALGLFEREVLLGVKGFSHDSVGEDMDLVMKIHEYCLENKIDYAIDFIPFPLCWTEVPPNSKILGTQRNRWMRGTIECMRKFKKFAFNPKYGLIGLISYPYWFLAEMMAPLLEVLGIFIIICFLSYGLINIPFALALFGLVYFCAIFLSIFSIAIYCANFKRYYKIDYPIKFLGAAMIEPFIYHPRVVYWSIRGYYDLLIKGAKGWGEMTRAGFGGK